MTPLDAQDMEALHTFLAFTLVRDLVVKFVAQPRSGEEKTGGRWVLYSRYVADRGSKAKKQPDLSMYSAFTVRGKDIGRKTVPLVRKAQDRTKDYAAFARTLSDQEKLLKTLRTCILKATDRLKDKDVHERIGRAKAHLLF